MGIWLNDSPNVFWLFVVRAAWCCWKCLSIFESFHRGSSQNRCRSTCFHLKLQQVAERRRWTICAVGTLTVTALERLMLTNRIDKEVWCWEKQWNVCTCTQKWHIYCLFICWQDERTGLVWLFWTKTCFWCVIME